MELKVCAMIEQVPTTRSELEPVQECICCGRGHGSSVESIKYAVDNNDKIQAGHFDPLLKVCELLCQITLRSLTTSTPSASVIVHSVHAPSRDNIGLCSNFTQSSLFCENGYD